MLQKTVSLHFSILLCIGLLIPVGSYGQQDKKIITGKWGIEANYLTGNFIKHGVDYIPRELAQGFEINYFKKTFGEKSWQKAVNFPEVGGSFTFIHFGDNGIFGDALALMVYGKFYMVRSKVVDFYTRIGGGYGVLTRKYNAASNPEDQLVSTTVNIAVQLRFGLEWKVNKYLQITAAASFNHFSNAGMHLPNYGINLPSGTLGIKVFPQPMERSYNCERHRDFKKNEIIWKASVGIQQLHSVNYYTVVPTRQYPVPSAMIAYARYINPGNKFYGGLAFEYFPSVRDYIIMNDLHTRYGATFEASIPSVIVGDEFILGRVSMFYSAGVYLWKSIPAVTPVYFKVGVNLFVYELAKKKGTKFFVGNNVKAHVNVAQYNELSVGGTF